MSGAKVAVVGSGGRESVFAYALNQSPEVETVYGLNGNPYFDSLEKGYSIPLKPTVENVRDFAVQESLDLVLFGPEAPLIAGGADAVRAAGILAIGPSARAARLEGSKIFADDFNEEFKIPRPDRLGAAYNEYQGLAFIDGRDPRSYVIKADGEAGGKGVGLPETEQEADEFIRGLFSGKWFGNAARRGVIFQHRDEGPEVSSFWLIDKNGHKVNLGRSQDHKRQLKGDKGPNTGGMGAYSPVPENIFGYYQAQKDHYIADRVIYGSREWNMGYEGFLYNGLMIVNQDPKVIEYNIRFGDPEAQVVIPPLVHAGMDMYEVLNEAAEGRLDKVHLPENVDQAAVTICLADGDYPNSTTPGTKIYGLDNEYENAIVFHGGVKVEGEDYVTAAGRVVTATGYGKNVDEAYANAEAVIGTEPDGKGVYFDDMQWRDDIADQARNTA